MNTHLAFQHHKWPSGGGGGGATVPTFVATAGLHNVPSIASLPLTRSYTMSSADNVLIAMLCYESNSTSGDTSIETGGANIPKFNAVEMVVGGVENSSRRQTCIFGINPGITSAANFVFDPAVAARGLSVLIEEWAGVDKTLIFSGATGTTFSASADVAVPITPLHTDGKVLTIAAFIDELVAVTAAGGTLSAEGPSGGTTNDLRSGYARSDVVTASVSQTATLTQAGNSSARGLAVELKPV